MADATSPELLLEAARRLGTFTRKRLAVESRHNDQRVKTWVARCEAQGLLRRVGVGPKAQVSYALAPEPAPPAPRDPAPRVETPSGNMWTAMRGLLSFTALDVAAHASTERTAVTEAEAAAYCRALLRAGYLRATRKAIPGQQPALYRLIRNTGPKPPRERRVTGVYDENLGRWAQLPGVEP